jgi:hypothetical protein
MCQILIPSLLITFMWQVIRLQPDRLGINKKEEKNINCPRKILPTFSILTLQIPNQMCKNATSVIIRLLTDATAIS